MYEIPLLDIRNSTPVELTKTHGDLARKLIHASTNVFGLLSRAASYAAFPVGDKLARTWLEKTNNPYREEILEYERILGIKGLLALNLCYEWGCTSGVYKKDGSAKLARVLDWPFPALGETMVVAHQRGTAGDFYNVTWPGLAGTFNAMAPDRFAAAIHQAPMRRYLTGIAMDWIRNRRKMMKETGLPPAHLLRKVFETARTYQEAKDMLCHEPICLPVIFVLSGTNDNEGCIIERLENDFAVREFADGDRVCAANHFESWLNGVGFGWMPRASFSTVFNKSKTAAKWLPEVVDSPERMKAAARADTCSINSSFDWFTFPVANPLSRLAMVADAGQKTLAVIGTSGATPASKPFIL